MGFSYTAKNTILNGMTGRSQYATLASTCMIGVGVMEGDVFTEPDATTGYNRTLLGNYQSADSKCMGEPVQGNIRNAKIIYLPEAVADWGTVTHFGLFSSASASEPFFTGELKNPIEITTGLHTPMTARTLRPSAICISTMKGRLFLSTLKGRRISTTAPSKICRFISGSLGRKSPATLPWFFVTSTTM